MYLKFCAWTQKINRFASENKEITEEMSTKELYHRNINYYREIHYNIIY